MRNIMLYTALVLVLTNCGKKEEPTTYLSDESKSWLAAYNIGDQLMFENQDGVKDTFIVSDKAFYTVSFQADGDVWHHEEAVIIINHAGTGAQAGEVRIRPGEILPNWNGHNGIFNGHKIQILANGTPYPTDYSKSDRDTIIIDTIIIKGTINNNVFISTYDSGVLNQPIPKLCYQKEKGFLRYETRDSLVWNKIN